MGDLSTMQTASYDELDRQVADLKKQLRQVSRFEEINKTLYKVSRAVSTTTVLDELYPLIRSALSDIIDTTNFFVALYEPLRDSLTFP